MRLMQRSWAALLVCATVWLVSCVDDNPVVPDQTYNADFELTGTTAIEAAMQFMRQFTEYQRSLDGKPTYGNAWDYLASNVVGTVGPSTTNAFYSPQFNQLVIFPAYMMPEIFPTDKDNAQRFAVSMVFSHELTHGFDPTGAKYDAQGVKSDWWTDEDKANFKLFQQQMIDRYNELEVLPGDKLYLAPADRVKIW